MKIGIISTAFVFLAIVTVSMSNEQRMNRLYSEPTQDNSQSIVPLNQIVSGGPPPDGIPSIDSPKFTTVDQAEGFMSDNDLILGVNINGDVKGYPLQIMVWHEIVNDNVGGTPIAVTYCPLCFTNQVFNRTVGGEILEFGTSGKLYNSNLVMYDRNSNSLWSQAMAQGIVGKFAGANLDRVPFDLAYWKDWKNIYPNSKILSKDTGNIRPYGADPYGDYYTNSDILFPVPNKDDRLGLKEIIIGVEALGDYKAYKLKDVENFKVIDDKINDKSITIWSAFPFMVKMFDPNVDSLTLTFRYDDEKKAFIDNQTGSEWNFDGKSINGDLSGKTLSRLPFDEGFWFEWVAFHPKTEVYSQ
jgi:hypothetical protein